MKKDKITIVTFLWGDWCAPYGAEYVYKLFKGINRNTTISYNFVCFSDRPDDFRGTAIDSRKLESPTWLGKLPKITAFNPNHGFEGQVFIFDLDTLIVGDLDEIFTFNGDFCARAWYKGIPRNDWVLDGDTISFKAGAMTDIIWKPFIENPAKVEQLTEGRERFWYRLTVNNPVMWQKLFPKSFLSYKNHCRRGLPKDAALVSFHGHPRIHECQNKWVQELWNA